MLGKESGVLAGISPHSLSHQYCSNGTIEVDVAGLIEAGVEAECVMLADGPLDDAKWAAESRIYGLARI